MSLESQSTAWLFAFTVGHLQTHRSQAKHMMQTHTHTKNPLTKNQKYEMRAGPTTLKNPEKQTLRKTTIRKSVQLSPKHCVRAGEKTPRCISRRCVACLLRPSRRRFSKVFQSDFSLEDGSWQTTTTGTNTPRFLEVSTKKKRQKNIVYVADPGLGHVVSFRMGLQFIWSSHWVQHLVASTFTKKYGCNMIFRK